MQRKASVTVHLAGGEDETGGWFQNKYKDGKEGDMGIGSDLDCIFQGKLKAMVTEARRQEEEEMI